MGFSQNFLPDGRGILASVTFTENYQLMTWLEFKLIQATIVVFKQLLQSVVKVISDATHVGAENILDGLVGITQPSSDGLVNKNYVEVFGPAVIISYDVVWLHVGCDESVRSALEEVAQLA